MLIRLFVDQHSEPQQPLTDNEQLGYSEPIQSSQ